MKHSVYITLGVMLMCVSIGVLYIFFFLDPSERQKRNETPAARALLPAEDQTQFTDLSGQPAPLDASFGKVMVVFSWASWCPQCGADMQLLESVAAKYDKEKVEFIALNRAEDRFSAERYLNTLPSFSNLSIRIDSEDHFFTEVEGYAMPELIVYGTEGNVLLHERGQVRTESVEEVLQNAVQ
jgi:thiol-disulfide isomerase/thioredoxin